MNLQSKVPSWIGYLLALFIVVLLLGCLGFVIPGTDTAFFLAFGWIWFLVRVIPQVRMHWVMVGNGAVYLIALLVGSHYFLRWLHREMTRASSQDSPPSIMAWRFSATLRIFGVIFLMFLVGMSTIGVAHQTAWLLTSPEPFFNTHDIRARATKFKCMANLKNIAAAFVTYANTHNGQYPDDLKTLMLSTGMTPQILICPASNDSAAEGTDPAKTAAELSEPGHCSYLYFAKGLTSDADSDTVLVTEPLENHRNAGINVLYGDYHVSWLAAPEAEQLLASLRAKAPTTAQSQPATQP